jgi:hypothetical protein
VASIPNAVFKQGSLTQDVLQLLLTYAGGFFSTQALSGALTLLASQVFGAGETLLQLTGSAGAVAVTTPTATQLIAQLTLLLGFVPPAGFNWQFEIQNENSGTVTLTAGTGITINGTAAVTNGTNRTWLAQVTNSGSSPAITFTNIASRSN